MDFVRFVPPVFAKLRYGGGDNSLLSHVEGMFGKIASDWNLIQSRVYHVERGKL